MEKFLDKDRKSGESYQSGGASQGQLTPVDSLLHGQGGRLKSAKKIDNDLHPW
jgi:hypothetical protein